MTARNPREELRYQWFEAHPIAVATLHGLLRGILRSTRKARTSIHYISTIPTETRRLEATTVSEAMDAFIVTDLTIKMDIALVRWHVSLEYGRSAVLAAMQFTGKSEDDLNKLVEWLDDLSNKIASKSEEVWNAYDEYEKAPDEVKPDAAVKVLEAINNYFNMLREETGAVARELMWLDTTLELMAAAISRFLRAFRKMMMTREVRISEIPARVLLRFIDKKMTNDALLISGILDALSVELNEKHGYNLPTETNYKVNLILGLIKREE